MFDNNDNIFAQMQMLSSTKETTYEESRKVLNELIEFMKYQDFQDEALDVLAEMRQLKKQTFIDADVFFVPDDLPVNFYPEQFHHDSLGFIKGSRVIYSGRLVYPVKDARGNVAGFVGYDAFEEPKYLDSKNHGYVAKRTMFYGMEDMREIYESPYCIFVEGPVCKLRLNENGFTALASLGSQLNFYMLNVIRRKGKNAIVLPDSDPAGDKYARQIKRYAPEARVHRFMKEKDFDDTFKSHPEVVDELRELISNPFKLRTTLT